MDSQLCRSVAANFNAKVLRKLQNAFAANPETDLLSVFPIEYSERLNRMKSQEAGKIFCPVFHLDLQSTRSQRRCSRRSDKCPCRATCCSRPPHERIDIVYGSNNGSVSAVRICSRASGRQLPRHHDAVPISINQSRHHHRIQSNYLAVQSMLRSCGR